MYVICYCVTGTQRRELIQLSTKKSKVMRFRVGGKVSKEKLLYDGIDMDEVGF